MRPTPYVASLRVYEPLSSFNKLDQILWSQIPVTADTTHEEQQRALRRTIVTEPPASKPDGAYILEIDG